VGQPGYDSYVKARDRKEVGQAGARERLPKLWIEALAPRQGEGGHHRRLISIQSRDPIHQAVPPPNDCPPDRGIVRIGYRLPLGAGDPE
jgi:hypothetical protein